MTPRRPSPNTAQIVVTFDDNRLAGELFGQFDQNLALIEQRLDIEATARGNHVALHGPPEALERARRTLDLLYARLKQGQNLTLGDVDGALRMLIDNPSPAPAGDAGTVPLSLSQVSTRRRTVSARTPAQDTYLKALASHDMVFASGPAGTGKTYLAVAYAAALLDRGEADRLILSRPAVEAGERLGFLPGDMREKVDPYLRPLYDALYDMMPSDKVERGLAAGTIEIAPLAFMRGRTLANAVVLLDEAQNTTSMQMKMFLTRLGENSKMVITGDPTQVDLPPGQTSGLAEAIALLEGIEGISVVRFTDADIVRHPLIVRIVRAYDAAGRREKPKNVRAER